MTRLPCHPERAFSAVEGPPPTLNNCHPMAKDGSLIEEIPEERQTPDQKSILEAVKKGRGFIPRPFLVWLHNPKLAVPWEAIGTYLNTGSTLTEREFEIAITVIARRTGSAFPLGAHLRNLTKTGHPQDVVDALRDGRTPKFATERERVIYEIAHLRLSGTLKRRTLRSGRGSTRPRWLGRHDRVDRLLHRRLPRDEDASGPAGLTRELTRRLPSREHFARIAGR